MIEKNDAACNLALTAGQEADVMQPSASSNTCPTCKSPIAADAPGCLCPVCSLVAAASVAPTTAGRYTPPPPIAEIAPHFPDLEILELLGAGGMGAVYKARQPQLDRFVALKILSHDLARDPAFVERFNREARVLARLSHPNIVGIHDFGTAGPYCCLTMEYVDGVNLRQAMRTGGFKPAEALALVQEICSALQFAHEEGILHRDIKPENVLLDSKGRVKIADFGIAKLVGGGAASDVTLTMQGSILGTPHYMAPEQIETPGDVDQRADIYSLGVVLYEMLTGGLPIGRFALPSEKAAMDARIDEIVMRTLEKERERRYQTVSELKSEFEGIEGPAAPSQAAFINWNEQILEGSKYTFWIAMAFLAMLFIDVGPAFFGDADDRPDRLGFTSFLIGASIFLSTVSAVLRVMHAIRTQGDQSGGSGPRLVSGHAPIPQGQRTANLGLTAAILTGISLLLAGVTLYVADTTSDADMRMIVVAAGLSLDGMIAFLGFILGAKALGGIRGSGGTEDGLGFAIFAVVAWPVCLMAALNLFSLSEPMPGSGGSGIPTSLALLLAGIPLLLASFVLIRGLHRWAKGVETKDGPRHFPGLTRTVLATLGLAILGPVLAVVVPRVFSSADRRAHSTDIELGIPPTRATVQWMEINSGLDAEEEVSWRGGKPDLTWEITVASGMKAELHLLLKDEDGSIRKFPLGDCASQINGSPGHARLKVGTVLTPGEPVSAPQTMTALFHSGDDGHLLHSLEDLRGFHFFGSHPTQILLESAGTQTIPFATRFEDGRETATGTLSLEAVVTLKRIGDE